MRDVEVAQLMALKAHLLVRQASQGEREDFASLAKAALIALKGKTDSAHVRRAVFYHLMLAELTRSDDPVPHRMAAMELAEQLEARGIASPVGPRSRQRASGRR